MRFNSLDDISEFCRALPAGDAEAAGAAAGRQQNLTKPPGSLGRLEELAIWLARWQQNVAPRLERVTIAVFAGNHGIAARGVSAYPAEVTAQMVANFAAGGAAINQLATLAGAELTVVPLELERPTRDFTIAAAMDTEDFLDAVDTGCRAVTDDCDLLVVGEMGIANTTTAATLCAALLGGGAARWAGRGTGIDDVGLSRKRAAIEAALKFHERVLGDPLAVAAALGGRELAAIAGAVLAARQRGVPVLLDGFV
ncbi:MAG: nicotinate-nucleotide--dimethylbenzimidazole phosphoribosyltransferase, partial [Sphingomonas sp.]